MIRGTTSLTDRHEEPEDYAVWMFRGVYQLDQTIRDFELRISEIEARLGLLPKAKSVDMGCEPGEEDLF